MFNYEGKTLLKCRPEKERLVEPFLGAVSSIFPPHLQMRTRRKACSRACGPLGYKIKKPDKEYKTAKNVYPPAVMKGTSHYLVEITRLSFQAVRKPPNGNSESL